MNKFKLGDKVRIIRRKPINTTGLSTGWDEPNGNVGEIGYITGDGSSYRVCKHVDHSDICDYREYFGFFDEDDLELVEEEKQPDVEAVPKLHISDSRLKEAMLKAAKFEGMVEAYEKILIGRSLNIGA